MPSITIPVDVLKAALAVIPKHEIRFYLNGLHINAQGRWLEATDGLIALRIPLPFEPPVGMGNVIVSRAVVEQMVDAAKADGSRIITLRQEGSKLYRTNVGAHDVVFGAVSAQFPDLDRVFTPGRVAPPADMRPYCLEAKQIDKWFKVQRMMFKTAYLHDGDEPPAQCGAGYLFKRNDVQCVIASCRERTS